MPKVKVLPDAAGQTLRWVVDGQDVESGQTYDFPEATVERLTTGRAARYFERVPAKGAKVAPKADAEAPAENVSDDTKENNDGADS